jgi:hypothetical protein
LHGGKTALRVSQALVAASLLVGCTTAPKAVSAVEIFSNENRPKVVLDSGTEAVGFSTVPAEQASPIVIDNTPTKVESPTPPATATQIVEKPTPTKTEILPTKEKVPWTEKYFLKKEDLPEGAIVYEDVPREDRNKLIITGPGQVFYQCNLPKQIEQIKKKNKYLTGWQFDLSQPNYKYCVPIAATEQQIKDYISDKLSGSSPEEQQASLERIISLSRAFTEAVPKDFTPYLDARYAFWIETMDGTTINWLLYEYDYSKEHPKGEWWLQGVLDILPPASTPTSTPTP